jgi:hypothetical protein
VLDGFEDADSGKPVLISAGLLRPRSIPARGLLHPDVTPRPRPYVTHTGSGGSASPTVPGTARLTPVRSLQIRYFGKRKGGPRLPRGPTSTKNRFPHMSSGPVPAQEGGVPPLPSCRRSGTVLGGLVRRREHAGIAGPLRRTGPATGHLRSSNRRPRQRCAPWADPHAYSPLSSRHLLARSACSDP